MVMQRMVLLLVCVNDVKRCLETRLGWRLLLRRVVNCELCGLACEEGADNNNSSEATFEC